MWPPIASERGGEPRCEQVKSRVPKKEVPINPINPRGGLGCSLCLRTEIERISLNFCPFEAAFSGIGRDFCFTEPGIF